MSGSGASNLGYGNIPPFSNYNGNYVNVDNSHSSALFGSNVIPGPPGLSGAKYNVDAAAGVVPGICLFKGGAKKLKTKIKNITKGYKKMKAGSRKSRSLKQRLRAKMLSRRSARGRMFASSRSRKNRQRRRSRAQRGGYGQYQNNLPMTETYSVGGILPPSLSALANPPPVQVLSNCTNCVDNYSRFTNAGFPSRGH
jgi:hypothetical protein